MRVLAIDTALAACAAAVLDTDHGIVASETLPMVRGHAESLIPLIARVMKRSDMTFRNLGRIAVTTGPGSFTGVRVGLAAARGFGVATGVPVVGVSRKRQVTLVSRKAHRSHAADAFLSVAQQTKTGLNS